MQQHYAIFDMDGTLVDSMPFWDMTCAEYLRKAEIDASIEELMDTLKPMTIRQTVDYLNEHFHKDLSPEVMSDCMCSIMLEHYKTDVPLKVGVVSFLERMRRNGVRMCVASSSPDHLIETCLERLQIRHYFEFILSAESVGNGKTEPDIFLKAAEMLGADPADTVVFEDAMAAGLTAKKAGFAVSAVYDEIGDAEWNDFRQAADYVIPDWSEDHICI